MARWFGNSAPCVAFLGKGFLTHKIRYIRILLQTLIHLDIVRPMLASPQNPCAIHMVVDHHLLAMASSLVHPSSDGLQPKCDGLHPSSNGLQPKVAMASTLVAMASNLSAMASTLVQPTASCR